MQRTNPWLDPHIQLLIALDEKCQQRQQEYHEFEFHILFDELVDELNQKINLDNQEITHEDQKKPILDLVLASQLKNKIIDSIKNSIKSGMRKNNPFITILPTEINDIKFNYTTLENHIKKIFYLYLENIDEFAIKYRFLSNLKRNASSKNNIDYCIQARGAVRDIGGKSLGLESKQLFLQQLTQANESIKIDQDRIQPNLEEYSQKFNRLSFEDIVKESIFFNSEADTSKSLTATMESMINVLSLQQAEALRYNQYIMSKRINASICTPICIDAFEEIPNYRSAMKFDMNNDTFDQTLLDDIEKIKKKYRSYKNAAFENVSYCFQVELQRLQGWFNISQLHFIAQLNLVCKKIYNLIGDLKIDSAENIDQKSLTEDLIIINRTITTPKKSNFERLKMQSYCHQDAGGKRKNLGILMITLGIGLIILSSVTIATSLGSGLIPGIFLATAGVSLLETGAAFWGSSTKRKEMASCENEVATILTPKQNLPLLSY